MLRLFISCLVLGVALGFSAEGKAPDGSVPPPSPRAAPLPLPPPDSEQRASYSLQAGRYYIASPNYPRNYPNNAQQSYTLRGASGQRVSIRCPVVRLENHSSCAYDSLSVNGRRTCGRRTVATVTAATVQVDFSSDGSVTSRGYYCLITVPTGSGGGGGGGGVTTTTTTTTTQAPTGDRCCGLPNRASRIVGGVTTEQNEYPWQAGLVSPGSTRTFCGGTVINNRYVLTAAHCTAGTSASRLQVLLREHRIGTSDGEIRYSVSRIIDHPSYQSASGSGYDFSLLRLDRTISFAGNRVAPACLPTGGDFTNVAAVVSGWGTTSSNGQQSTILREVTVRTMSNAQCRSNYGNSINTSMLCAGVSGGGKDSCQGDSGGPLVSSVGGRYNLIGVVSWGRGCALANYPGVYARVTTVLSWIEQNTRDASLC